MPLMFKKFLNLCLNKIGLSATFSEPWKWIDHINERRYNNTDDDRTEDDKENATPDQNDDEQEQNGGANNET